MPLLLRRAQLGLSLTKLVCIWFGQLTSPVPSTGWPSAPLRINFARKKLDIQVGAQVSRPQAQSRCDEWARAQSGLGNSAVSQRRRLAAVHAIAHMGRPANAKQLPRPTVERDRV